MIELKNTITILVIIAVLLTHVGTAIAATTPVRVFVDGTEVQFPDQRPLINSDSRTLVPVRFVSEALGAEVGWDGTNKQVKINYQGKTIILQMGVKAATVGLSVTTLDTAPALVNSRTMVPLRFVSEVLGAQVQWDGAQQAIYITTKNSDQALVDSSLTVDTPPPADNPNNVNLIVSVYYTYNTPIEPQLVDLQEILAKRFNGAEAPVMEYVRSKNGTDTRLATKSFNINGKTVGVYDSIGTVSVTVWN